MHSQTSAIPTGHYLWAVFIPIVGAVLAIKAWSRSQIGPGFALMATAALSQVVWMFVVLPAL